MPSTNLRNLISLPKRLEGLFIIMFLFSYAPGPGAVSVSLVDLDLTPKVYWGLSFFLTLLSSYAPGPGVTLWFSRTLCLNFVENLGPSPMKLGAS